MQLREYIDLVEKRAIATDNLNEELAAWLDWARKKADWLDPLMERVDEWLTDVDPNSLLKDQDRPRENNFLSYNQLNYNSERSASKRSWPALLPWYLK